MVTSRVTWATVVWPLLGSILVCASPALAQLDEGLVGYYRFDGAGDTLRDATGNGSDGVLVGAKRTLHGRFGKALEFDTRTGAELPDTLALMAKDEFTTGLWVKPTQGEADTAEGQRPKPVGVQALPVQHRSL